MIVCDSWLFWKLNCFISDVKYVVIKLERLEINFVLERKNLIKYLM